MSFRFHNLKLLTLVSSVTETTPQSTCSQSPLPQISSPSFLAAAGVSFQGPGLYLLRFLYFLKPQGGTSVTAMPSAFLHFFIPNIPFLLFLIIPNRSDLQFLYSGTKILWSRKRIQKKISIY